MTTTNAFPTFSIIQTKRQIGNWQSYTGHFRLLVDSDQGQIAFALPGRGGRVTRQAAGVIKRLWLAGATAIQIQNATGWRVL